MLTLPSLPWCFLLGCPWELQELGVGYSGKDAEIMRLEILNGHLSYIVSVAAQGNKFVFRFVLVPDDALHGFRYFIVQDMLLSFNTCVLEAFH